MSFNEKLQKLRKENKYSQEELADLLDVTRQSVSKWESGQTYPEMDKLLAICKIFNCSLDDLTNDEIKEISADKKNDINSVIDSALSLIDKAYKMFTHMEAKEIARCGFIMFAVAVILALFSIPIQELQRAFYYMIDTLGYPTVTSFCSSLFNLILDLTYAVLYVLLFVYIFKLGFLDKFDYTVVKTKAPENKTINEEEQEETPEVISEEIPVKEPVIKIKRDHDYPFFKILGAIVMFFIKIILVCFSLPFLALLFALFAVLVLTIYLITQGVLFISILLFLVFGIILTSLVIEFVANITFNKKGGYKRMLITFLVGMAGVGAATGFTVIELNSIKYIDSLPDGIEKTKETFEYTFEENMFFGDGHYYLDINYIPRESIKDKVVVEVEYYKEYTTLYFHNWQNQYYVGSNGFVWENYKNYYDLAINALKKKTWYNYSNLAMVKVTVCAKAENINKMKANLNKFIEEEKVRQAEYDYYENQINSLYQQIYELEQRLYESESKREDLLWKIDELKEEIKEYKEKIKSILD